MKDTVKVNNKVNSQGGFAGVVVILVVLLLLGAGLFYAVRSGMFLSLRPKNNVVVKDEKPTLVKVDFSYTVKSITADTIVLNGDKGEFTLPYDSQAVSVYKGATKTSPIIPLAELEVGDKVNMEFIPGQSATLFVVQ